MGQEACPSLLSASGQRWGRSPWVHAGAGRGGWGPLTSSSPLPAQGWAPPAGGDAPAESRRVALGARWGLRTPRRAWLLGSGGRLPGLREVGGVRPWVRLLEVGASKAWAGACPPPPPAVEGACSTSTVRLCACSPREGFERRLWVLLGECVAFPAFSGKWRRRRPPQASCFPGVCEGGVSV